jgi:hypothetical protein
MIFSSSAVTTIHGRSFAGVVVAHLAVTLVVGAGLVLLLPVPTLAEGFPAAISMIATHPCHGSAESTRGHQLIGDDAELTAPDSDDDDDDDDAPTGSDAAIAVDHCRTTARGDVSDLVHVEAESWVSRTVEGHSLRGPPSDDDTSSDADDDYDNDDDPCAEYSAPREPEISHVLWILTPAEFVSTSSTRTSDLSPRAPPL